MSKTFIKTLTLFLMCLFVLTGCSISFKKKVPVVSQNNGNQDGGQNLTIKEQLAAQTKIKKFANYEELKEFLENNNVSNSYSGYGRAGSWEEATTDAIKSVAPAREMLDSISTTGLASPMAAKNESGAGQTTTNDFSKTNVQVEGVDEADIIKTDGNYIYAVAKKSLFIISAVPAEGASIVSKIEFKARPQDIYINGNYLVIYGDDSEIYNGDLYKTFRRRNSYVFLKVFDISDKKNPKQIRDVDMEGSYIDSRMIGDYVYFVTSNYNYYYIPEEPIVPRIVENGKVLPEVCGDGAKCFAPDIYYFDMPYDNYNFTTVTAINVKDVNSQINGQVYMMSYGQNLYVSQNNLYITYTKYISEYDLTMEVLKEMILPKLPAKDQERIVKIEQTDSFILSKSEKMAKIGMIIDRYRSSLTDEEQKSLEEQLKAKMKQKYQDISKELEKTVIHKIAISNGKLEYKIEGEVTGSILNQFSMDENNNYFRIATTKNQTWSEFADESQTKSYNNLYVLDENLKTVGAVENLAEGERIYSVRFMQNRAYMVTFKQTDPLFVIDLTNPQKPTVLGKLKIPGFSSYLHPYDDTTLIGIGKDAKETEWGGAQALGLKISLFDVSDVANPKETATYRMGDMGSDSIALNDHKAFLFSREKSLLAIPVSIRESSAPDEWGKLTFSGAAVFTINKNSIELKGKIDHSDNGKPAGEDYWGGYNYYDNTVKRCLYINDMLYTFSNYYLKMNKLENLDTVNSLPLEKVESNVGVDYRVVN